jgi:hypothetical protein
MAQLSERIVGGIQDRILDRFDLDEKAADRLDEVLDRVDEWVSERPWYVKWAVRALQRGLVDFAVHILKPLLEELESRQ